ncbi:MAG: SGNH/GDSL hydrolase family protein [Planctomycetes bacterium]|nr:SGNH/GDSL hydrolase family protein [Planctomycetota bacterium]
MHAIVKSRTARQVLFGLGCVCGLAGLFAMQSAGSAEPAPRLQVGTLPVGKILFLGNSITLHGPAANIGWTGNWGMAASAKEKDYVHRLLDRINKKAGGTPQVMVRNIAEFERNLTDYSVPDSLKDELAFEADVVILAIGENAMPPETEAARERFATALRGLLAEIRRHGHPTIIVRSQFWPDAVKDGLLKQECATAGGIFVDIKPLGTDPANAAKAERDIEHAGVAAHPGDKGMDAIAEALWKALQQAGTKPAQP